MCSFFSDLGVITKSLKFGIWDFTKGIAFIKYSNHLEIPGLPKNNPENYNEELPKDLSVEEVMELIENEAKRMEEKEDDPN